MISGSKSSYIPTLDGWRGIAILLVLICHGFAMLQGPNGFFPNEFWRAITVKGSFGVQLFFGISGLLICSRLLDEEDGPGRINLKGFYVRRAFRILPPYAVNLAVIAALAWLSLIQMTAREWWSSVFFVRNFMPVSANEGWYTGHFWSLMVEEHFYLLAPALLILAPKNRRLILFVALCFAISFWRWFAIRNQIGNSFLEPGQSFTGRTDCAIDALFWGASGAVALRYHGETVKRILLVKFMVPLLLVAVTLTEFVRVPQKGLVQGTLVVALLLATILNPTVFLSRMLEKNWIKWIGRMSYSLYIWNQLFLIPDSIVPVAPLSYLQYPPINIVCVFGLATLSYYFVEKPMIRTGRQVANRLFPAKYSAPEVSKAA